MSALKRPLVRWHGGKWVLAPWIIEHFPEHRVYVEPFGGGGSVLLRKPRCYAEVYNDLDGEIVNLFRMARERGLELVSLLRMTPFARDEFKQSYEPADNPLEQARRTVVRSFMGFGSNAHNKATGFRNNSNRSGTTPAHDWANYPDALDGIVDRLRGVVIENKDAMALCPQTDSEDTLFYVDPPYVFSTRSDDSNDYRHELSDDDHGELGDMLLALRGSVIVSGYPSPLYESIFAGWHRVERDALADGAAKRKEVLWINDRCWSGINASKATRDLFSSAPSGAETQPLEGGAG